MEETLVVVGLLYSLLLNHLLVVQNFELLRIVDLIPVAVAAAPAAAEEDNAGSGVKTVVLKAAGAQKLQVIKVIREVTGLGLKEAKDIADNGGNVKEGIDKAEAEQLKAQFEEAGATVELK